MENTAKQENRQKIERQKIMFGMSESELIDWISTSRMDINMLALSILSDVQEMLEFDGEYQDKVRQLLNRVKYIVDVHLQPRT